MFSYCRAQFAFKSSKWKWFIDQEMIFFLNTNNDQLLPRSALKVFSPFLVVSVSNLCFCENWKSRCLCPRNDYGSQFSSVYLIQEMTWGMITKTTPIPGNIGKRYETASGLHFLHNVQIDNAFRTEVPIKNPQTNFIKFINFIDASNDKKMNE